MVTKVGTNNAEWLVGTADADEIWGLNGDDAIAGGGGKDRLFGGEGADFIDGGAGDDWIEGGAGADRIIGGDGIDTLSFTASDAKVNVNLKTGVGEGGHAQGDTYAGIENVHGSSFGDVIMGNSARNIIFGFNGKDQLYGMEGDDVLIGGQGDDILFGGAGADYLDGGAGDDTVSYGFDASGVYVDLVRNVFSGGAQGDVLISIENVVGSAHADVLRAGAGSNRLYGQDGDDVLIGGAGADRLDGGKGVDTASYRDSLSGVRVDLYNGQGTAGDAAGDILTMIENVNGSLLDDEIIGDNGDNRIDGDAGNDVIRGGMGNDTLIGGAGDDRITGGAGNDRLEGGAGDDILIDLDGANTFVGGGGADLVDYSGFTRPNEAVSVNLSTGKGDWMALGDTYSGVEKARGGAGADHLTGSAGANSLDGGDGNDVLAGLGGADRLYGQDGIDTVTYAASGAGVLVVMTSGRGYGGDAEGDRLFEVENLIGSAFDDHFEGDAGDNVLSGGAGDDRLLGGVGNDTLIGGAGRDYLYGGPGADTFRYGGLSESGLSSATRDRIIGWGQADVIDLSRIDARPDLAGEQAFAFIGNEAFSGLGQVRFYTDGDATYIQVNGAGGLAADMSIRIDGVQTLTADDFIL